MIRVCEAEVAGGMVIDPRPTRYRGAVKSGDPAGTQWRQDMQVEWLKAAIRAQERRDEPEIDFDSLRMPCPRT